MKNLIFLLIIAILSIFVFVPLALADHRLDLQTNTIHIPYDQADADRELKLSDGGSSISTKQLPNGNYHGWWRQVLRDVPRFGVAIYVDVAEVDVTGFDTKTTTCPQGFTQGVIVDENGNEYVSNQCHTRFVVERTDRNNKYDVELYIHIVNAVPATPAEAAAAEVAGMSIAERQGFFEK